jgi:hypothetical protein
MGSTLISACVESHGARVRCFHSWDAVKKCILTALHAGTPIIHLIWGILFHRPASAWGNYFEKLFISKLRVYGGIPFHPAVDYCVRKLYAAVHGLVPVNECIRRKGENFAFLDGVPTAANVKLDLPEF